ATLTSALSKPDARVSEMAIPQSRADSKTSGAETGLMYPILWRTSDGMRGSVAGVLSRRKCAGGKNDPDTSRPDRDPAIHEDSFSWTFTRSKALHANSGVLSQLGLTSRPKKEIPVASA
ncbi:MAG: hypothetical protein QOD84_2147, partial [Acidobacteriaceae bacterium]